MLWYVPLEAYKERYTGQLAEWMRKAFAANEVNYTPVIPELALPPTISTGQVLDANNRVQWATSQVQMLVHSMASGAMKDGDHILLMDFWHPGLDGLFYALHQYDLKRVKVSAYCWAQSVDQYDFTHPMRSWMRPVEQGYANRMTDIFVADDGLAELLVAAGVGTPAKVHTVGLPFDSKAVWDKLVSPGYSFRDFPKKDQVVYSSRFDSEKDPEFFLDVARAFKKRWPNCPVDFVMCSSANTIRSDSPFLVERLLEAEKDGVVKILTGLSKEVYYSTLLHSKVQFNCALQDWVSFTLLEAVTFGCYPVYPMRRSFPEALRHEPAFLYRPEDVDDACERLWDVFCGRNRNWFSPEAIKARQDLILPNHDQAIAEILGQVGEHRHLVADVGGPAAGLEKWKKWRRDNA